MPSIAILEQNATLVRKFQPLPRDEMDRLAGELSEEKKVALDTFFERHIDG
jgi:hypothetical protein